MFSRLSCEETLGLVSMALALAVLLVRVLHIDLFVHQKLLVHTLDRFVRGLEGVV